MQVTRDLIMEAVNLKKPFRTVYQGHVRFLCGHGLGYKNRKDGSRVLQLVAYQFDGQTSKGSVASGENHKENWRCFDVSQMMDIEFTDDTQWYNPV